VTTVGALSCTLIVDPNLMTLVKSLTTHVDELTNICASTRVGSGYWCCVWRLILSLKALSLPGPQVKCGSETVTEDCTD
jgi:hypothetical protein